MGHVPVGLRCAVVRRGTPAASRERRTMPADILPVIFGDEVEAYGFARLFHETYGITAHVVAPYPRGPINNSRILTRELVGRGVLSSSKLIPVMNRIATEHPGKRLIGLINSDRGIEVMTHHAGEVDPAWFLPIATPEAVDLANSKEEMARVYEELGLAAPPRATLSLAQPDTWEAALAMDTFPVVIKPSHQRDLVTYRTAGLHKVETADSAPQLRARLEELAAAGAKSELIIQQLIPGDDTCQWVVNGYVDRSGAVTAAGSGQVLLGLHHPMYLGNAGFIMLNREGRFVEDAIRVVQRVGLRGFFSMDVKVDPRTGTAYWLDLNPRAGRGHYYLKVGGVNLATALVDDLEGTRGHSQRVTEDGIFRILPASLLSHRYLRDPALYAEVKRITRARKPVDPLNYAADRNLKRTLYRLIHDRREAKAMRTYYPRVTRSGF